MKNELLKLRVYDVMNLLGNQIMNNETTEEYIELEAMNGLNNKKYDLKIILKEVGKT